MSDPIEQLVDDWQEWCVHAKYLLHWLDERDELIRRIRALVETDRHAITQALLKECPGITMVHSSRRDNYCLQCNWVRDWIRANGLLLKEEE